MVRTFASAAPVYDTVIPWFGHFGRVLAEAAAPGPSDKVLDVATGRGAVLFGILDGLCDDGYAIGVDLTPEMVHLTRQDIASRRICNAAALVGDAEQLPFGDGSFDLVLCAHAVNFFPDSDRALHEMRRVVRVGGRVAISMLSTPHSEIDFFPEMAMQALPTETLRSLVPADKVDGNRRRLFDPSEHLAQAGLTDIAAVTTAADFTLPDEEAWWALAQTHGDRQFFDVLDPETLADVKRMCFERLRNQRKSEGFALRDRVQIAIGTRTS